MTDINLLSTSGPRKDGHDKNRPDAKGRQEEELALHIPPSEPEERLEPSAGNFVPPAAPVAPKAPPTILSQKVRPLPNMAAIPKPVVPQLNARVAVPMPPQPPLSPSAEEKGTGSGTLRVSLITTGAGAGLSEIALRRRLRLFALFGLFGLLLNGAVFGGLLYRKSMVERRNAAAAEQLQDIDTRIAARERELVPARDFQQLIRAEQAVLDNHAHWSGVLRLLEETALQEVQFGSLAGADTGTLSFEIFARDYTTLAKQIVAFRQDSRVRKVTVGTASAAFGENELLQGVRAEATLQIDPSVFRFDPEKTGFAPATL